MQRAGNDRTGGTAALVIAGLVAALGCAAPRAPGPAKPAEPRGEPAASTPAAAEGAEADFRRGLRYLDGEGVPQDYAEAARWIRRAAEEGHPEAQYRLGIMLANGVGVPRDPVRAHMWLNLASAGLTGDRRREAIHNRYVVEKQLSAAELAEAQRLAQDWTPSSHGGRP